MPARTTTEGARVVRVPSGASVAGVAVAEAVPMAAAAPGGRRGQRGSVTAETAMVLPVLAAMAMALCWLVLLAAAQVRVVDAAREVARASARDDDPSRALALGRRVAPRGSRISVRSEGDTVVVSVRSRVQGPRGLMVLLPTATLHAEAVAAREQQ